jgi:hypothetical protein
MSSILYYSNYCDKCKNLLQILGKSKRKEETHFICIDKRMKDVNNAVYIILENGQRLLLPPQVTRVPALLLLNKEHTVLFGEQIYQHLQPRETEYNRQATNNNGEPQPFAFSGGGGGAGGMFGVASDSFSFWDQDSNDLSAKGAGGTRQMYNYATIDQGGTIETPPEDYNPDKIGEVSVSNLEQKRNQDLPPGPPPPEEFKKH